MEELRIQHHPEQGKFLSELAEEEAYLAYRTEGEILDLYSTYVPNAFRGKGIAGRLVKEALEYARMNGYRVRPSCPYVASYIDRHTEYEDLIA